MISHFKRACAVLGIATVGSLGLVACSETGGGDGTALVGEGATSQQKAIDYFAQQYAWQTGGSVSYNATGSGSGQKNFIAGQVHFGGSDSPLKDEQIPAAAERCQGNPAWHIPLVVGPVAIAYNLPGVDNLALSTDLLAQIFKGDVNRWNDPAIAALNAGVELPDVPISVIYRSEESGTTDNFQKFLAASTGNWEGKGKSFPKDTGAGANGSNGVVGEVAKTEGAITYVEAGYAKEADLGIAAIDFGSGPVELMKDNVNAALAKVKFSGEGHDLVVDANRLFSLNEPGAYPLVLTPYEIVCSAGNGEKTQGIKDFLNIALQSQDENLEKAGYIPVDGAFKEKLQAAVNAIQ